MIAYWIGMALLLLLPPFLAVKAWLRFSPESPRLRLLVLSTAMLPGIALVLLTALTIAFVIEDRSIPPDSLDDAPQRSLFILWTLYPVIGFVAACCGFISGWLAVRTSGRT